MAYDDATRSSLLPNVKPLDCPDCGSPGALRLDWKPDQIGGSSRVMYRCSTKGCRGWLAARADGSPVGTPGDARTRSARKALQERLGRIWRQAGVVASEMLVAAGKPPLQSRAVVQIAQARGRTLLYRWVAWTLKRDSSKARIPQMSLEDCAKVAAACDKIQDDFRAIVAWSKGRRKKGAKRGDGAARRRHSARKDQAAGRDGGGV